MGRIISSKSAINKERFKLISIWETSNVFSHNSSRIQTLNVQDILENSKEYSLKILCYYLWPLDRIVNQWCGAKPQVDITTIKGRLLHQNWDRSFIIHSRRNQRKHQQQPSLLFSTFAEFILPCQALKDFSMKAATLVT